MGGVVDTNILIFAANESAEEHQKARTFLAEALDSAESFYLSEGIAYEFLRVVTHPRVFDRPLPWKQAMQFLSVFLESDAFSVLVPGDAHWTVLDELLSELRRPAGNLFFDVRTAALMREHGVRQIYTADTDFLQFAGLQVTNPLQ